MKAKITKRLVEDLTPDAGTDLWVWDKDLPGFGVRVKPSGVRAYVIQYRNGRRQSRKFTLGRHGVLTPEQARRLARQALAAVERGEDPAHDRRVDRGALSVADLAKRFDEEHIAVRLKPSTAREYRRNLRRFILPALGRLTVADVVRADIARFHHGLRHLPYQANRNLEVISKMFNLAEMWGLRPDGSNPRRHIKKYPEEKRERYLSPVELAALGEALARAEREGLTDEYAVAAIRLLIFTGHCLRLSDTKTGARVVHLGQPALDVLAGIARQLGNPWVICGRLPRSRRTDLQPPWQRMRKRATVRFWARAVGSEAAALVERLERDLGREPTYDECLAEARERHLELRAGLVDVRIHDLRHSFASGTVALGESLPMIGKLLGHTQVQTTARYAHLAADPVKAAAERVTSNIASILGGGQDQDTDAAVI